LIRPHATARSRGSARVARTPSPHITPGECWDAHLLTLLAMTTLIGHRTGVHYAGSIVLIVESVVGHGPTPASTFVVSQTDVCAGAHKNDPGRQAAAWLS
jgi:hypothetical protein